LYCASSCTLLLKLSQGKLRNNSAINKNSDNSGYINGSHFSTVDSGGQS
jgi:hypothetical protein